MEFINAEVKKVMEIKGTVFNIDKAKGGFTNEETGEISKPTFRLVFIETVESETEDSSKTNTYSIKIEDIEELETANKLLNPLRFKLVEVKNINFGKYQDKNGAWHDWYKCKFEDIKEIGK